MQMENMSWKAGQKYKIRVKPNSDCSNFAVNIGHDSKNYALHFNPRFNYAGKVKSIVLNNKTDGTWGQEQIDSTFPFEFGKESKFYISFDKEAFEITFPDGKKMTFPNRFGEETYDRLTMVGRAELIGFRFIPA